MTSNITNPKPPQGRRQHNLRRLQAVLILIGLCVSGYLSYLKAAQADAVCVESGPFNCNLVLNSQYSELAGLPIAWLGFAVYLGIGLLTLLEGRVRFLREYGSLLVFGIGLFAWLFSMWLVYVQFVLLEALCPWCLTHELNFTILFGAIAFRVFRDLAAEENH